MVLSDIERGKKILTFFQVCLMHFDSLVMIVHVNILIGWLSSVHKANNPKMMAVRR